MKTITSCFILFLISYTSFGQVSYTTSCKIEDGEAHGYVHNHKDAFTVNGTVWFYFYDKDGVLFDSEDEREYEYISYCDTEEVEYTSAPSEAYSCSFDVSTATDVKNEYEQKQEGFSNGHHELERPKSGVVYNTSCKIKDGTAHGYVHNHKDHFRISGKVWFYFYDKDGDFIDSEDEYESELVWRESTEEIETTSAPSDACSCFFEVKDAIED